MTILLFVLVLMGWVIAVRGNGLVSLASALILGFTVYTVPALLGYYLRPGVGGLLETTVSAEAIRVLVWAWFCVVVTIMLTGSKRIAPAFTGKRTVAPLELGMYDSRAGLFCLMCVLASTGLYAWIAVLDSPLYFLEERQVVDVRAERQKLLWKWVNLFGLIAALLIRSRVAVVLFLGFILVYFLAGDRTMILITGVAVAVYFFQGERDLKRLVRFDLLFLVVLVALLILLGKPIYHSVKMQTVAPLEMVLSPRNSTILLSFFEPLFTHNILEDVVHRQFSYSWWDLLYGVVGQVLIVPAAFGIDSSAFNVQLQQTLYPQIRFGVANHYFAQGWSTGGWHGIALFAFILASSVRLFQTLAYRASPLPRILWVVMGVVVGTYFFRNSLENILSMLRQIVVVGVVLLLATQFMSHLIYRLSGVPLRPVQES